MEATNAREEALLAEIEMLRARLAEPEETLAAIRDGKVDAFVVSESVGEKVYALRSADPPFRVMVEEMREGAATVDSRGTILYANGQLSRLLHRPSDLLRGSSLRDFLPDEERPALERLFAGGRGGRGEITFRSERGRLFPAQISFSPVTDEGLSAFCLIVTDLTEEKRRTSRAAAEETWREANRRKDEFLAILSHELRNPLAAIGNASEILTHLTTEDSRVRWATAVIDRQVQHLGRMVDDLLDVSRIANGKIDLRHEVFDLAGLVGRVLETHRRREGRRTVHLALPSEPILVYADATRIAQVVANLLHNAEKFTGETGRIDVELMRREDRAVLSVRDDGVGIPAENLEGIFDLFAQIDRPLSRPEGGLGIGLTLVRKLLDLHGGEVRAESEGVGRGSAFFVTLPVARDPQVRAGAGSGEPTAEPAAPRRILVVEDYAESAESLAMLLRISGHEVEVAADGPSAIAKSESFRPDLVLLDIGLPGMDGYECGRRLRELLGPGVRIVALTGYGQAEDRRLSAEAGIDQHVVKPIRPDAIARLIRVPGRRG